MPLSRKTRRSVLIVVGVGALFLFSVAMNTNPPTNRAQTAPDAPDPALQTRVYGAPVELVARAVQSVRISTYGCAWKLDKGANGAPDKIVFRVPVIVFTDILTVSLQSAGENKTRVDVESHSQIGKGDFGENRRHIKQLLNALDVLLPRA